VEGTLVDSVLPISQSWRETLAEVGINTHIADLHRFSGMDGREMLERLLGPDAPQLDGLIERQGALYRERFLPEIKPSRGARPVRAHQKQGVSGLL
jgi:beta-phosphoglucomutase-like phosphatase (HAD superfamily)